MKNPKLLGLFTVLLWLVTLLAAACNTSTRLEQATQNTASYVPLKSSPSIGAIATEGLSISTPKPTATEWSSPTPLPPGLTPSSSPSTTPSPTYTSSITATITPTYAILRGEVLIRANCRYGPGAPYLYKYGLVAGSNLEVIGRTDTGAWILVRAIGGNNPCWVKASLMELRGDVMAVQPTYIPLPPSPYYGPLKGVSARRDGDIVTVFWSPLSLRAGDDSEQTPYVIEAWVCIDAELVFTPVGAFGIAAEITDESGCSEPSHGRITAAEKHGYTPYVEIPWP